MDIEDILEFNLINPEAQPFMLNESQGGEYLTPLECLRP